MEGQIQVTVLGVTGRTSKDGQHQMYDVAMSDGKKYTTFDADLAGLANGLQGQNVIATVEVEQKGRYTNYNLVNLGGSAAVPALAVGTAIPAAGIPMAAPSPVAGIPMAAPSSGGGMSDADKARISRLSAVSTAFDFVGALFSGAGPEAMKEALGLARGLSEGILQYGTQGSWPGGIQATPAGIAAQVPGVEVGAPVEAAAVAPESIIPWD